MKSIREILTKVWSVILTIWKDPVWSKIIAALLILLITTIWASINQYSVSDIYKMILLLLNIKMPVYIIFSLFGVLFFIKFIVWLFRGIEDSIWKEKIGDYTYKELCKILQSQKLPIQTKGMEMAGIQPPQEDLLVQFYINKIFLNAGVTLERPGCDWGYLYAVLCPKLMSYGLVEQIDCKEDRAKMDIIKYQTTELGHKFYRLIEKSIFIKRKKLFPK